MANVETFRLLLGKALLELQELPPPVVRLAGPLRSGGDGYEENLRRFKIGQALLVSRGMTVFSYQGKYAEAIQAGYELHFEHFHIPILESGLIAGMHFLPKWNESRGASYERELCEKLSIPVNDIAIEELNAFEASNRET